jgi:hypothetical protein
LFLSENSDFVNCLALPRVTCVTFGSDLLRCPASWFLCDNPAHAGGSHAQVMAFTSRGAGQPNPAAVIPQTLETRHRVKIFARYLRFRRPNSRQETAAVRLLVIVYSIQRTLLLEFVVVFKPQKRDMNSSNSNHKSLPSELARIHAKLSGHLNVHVRKVESFSRVNPRLVL